MTDSRPGATAVAILFLAGLLACLAGRFRASEIAAESIGPTHIAAVAGRVAIFAAGTLHLLDADGLLLDRVTLASLGLDGDPIDLRWLEDGRLLVALQRPARLAACDLEIRACELRPMGGNTAPQRQFKVWPPDASGRLLFTDARGDALKLQAAPDSAARSLLPPRTLAAPNDLAFDATGTLWVADTDHRRIVEVATAPDGNRVIGREWSTANHVADARRPYPIMLAADTSGRLWVTQASEFSDGLADVVVYDPDEGAVARVDLPDGRFATDITALGGDLLVTDLDRHRIYRVDAGSFAVSSFGDAVFREAMTALAQRRDRFERLSTLAMVGVFVCAAVMIGAAFFATPRNRRWTAVPGNLDLSAVDTPMPPLRGVHWLNRAPAFERSLKWIEHSGIVFAVLIVIFAAAAFYWAQTPEAGLGPQEMQILYAEIGKLLALLLILTAALVLVLRVASRTLRIRLGTDGRSLLLRFHDGRQVTVPPADLAWSNRMILYGRYRIPLQGGRNQRIYAEGELETWIAPLLRDARRVSEWDIALSSWRGRERAWMWIALALVLAGFMLWAAGQFMPP